MLLTCPRDNFVPVGSERREGEISSTYSPVVYLSLPTSNHNQIYFSWCSSKLYIFRFLHQTTTYPYICAERHALYIFRFLHQTTTVQHHNQFWKELYIFRFLHQTTTEPYNIEDYEQLYIFRFLHQTTTFGGLGCSFVSCISFASYIKPQLNKIDNIQIFSCISFASYIKPQPDTEYNTEYRVVYLSLPTSNHNL